MKERPIIFSGDMVRAILEGRKVQTRRPCKAQLTDVRRSPFAPSGLEDAHGHELRCPYGYVGDHLWVRETWRIGAWREDGRMAIDYAASPELTRTPWVTIPNDDDGEAFNGYWINLCHELQARGVEPDQNDGEYHWEPGKAPLRWRSPIYMPRWASRLTLELIGLRIERLHEITDEDLLGEALSKGRGAYRLAWDDLYAKRGLGWDANPWVWAITFRLLPNSANCGISEASA